MYTTDVYVGQQGMALDLAVVQGGALAFVAYSLLGRGVGCPLAGKLSDVLARRGISRSAVLIGWLLFAIATLLTLSAAVSTIGTLIVLLVLLGMSVNLFSLVPAAISETYGPLSLASLSSFTNTLREFRAPPFLPSAAMSASRSTPLPATRCRTTAASG